MDLLNLLVFILLLIGGMIAVLFGVWIIFIIIAVCWIRDFTKRTKGQK